MSSTVPPPAPIKAKQTQPAHSPEDIKAALEALAQASPPISARISSALYGSSEEISSASRALKRDLSRPKLDQVCSEFVEIFDRQVKKFDLYFNDAFASSQRINRSKQGDFAYVLGKIHIINNKIDELVGELVDIVQKYSSASQLIESRIFIAIIDQLSNKYKGKIKQFRDSINYLKEPTRSPKYYIDEALLKLELLTQHVQNHGSIGTPELAATLFPEWLDGFVGAAQCRAAEAAQATSEPLPTSAPEIWPGGKSTKESPPEFIMRVYAPWIGKGLTMADVRHFDERLAQSLYHHIRQERPIPDGFALPTKYEEIRKKDEAALPHDPAAAVRSYHRDRNEKRRSQSKSLQRD